MREQLIYATIGFGLLFVMFTNSCRLSFEETEVEFFQVYDEGDTLLFQNSSGKIDSFLIARKSFYNSGWNEGMGGNYSIPVCAIEYEHIPPKSRLQSFGPSGSVHSTLHSLLFAIKKTPSSPLIVELRFEGFGATFEARPNAFSPHGEIYELVHYCLNCSGLDDNAVVKLVWDTTVGIRSYVTKDGTMWTRVKR